MEKLQASSCWNPKVRLEPMNRSCKKAKTNNKELIIRTRVSSQEVVCFLSLDYQRHLNRSKMTTCQGYRKGFLGWNCHSEYMSLLYSSSENLSVVM